MVSQRITCQSIFIECFKPRTGSDTNKRLTRNKQPSSSPQRISMSDISWQDGSFEVTINDISNSLIGSRLFDFTLEELRRITNNCTSANYLGEGGFGAVYKGFIDDKLRPGLEAQPVAVKVLDLEGDQGHREWLAEVIFLGQLRHPNLVKLIGYCCENDQRMLVYEYMERGNLDRHLFSRFTTPLPWLTRMKIALGAAKGLDFLHEEEKPVIFRDFKGANILLSADYTAKLSDFGFARDGPEDDESHISTNNILGTKGYVAPEYIMTGHLTTMSDVYSFGVVLLELLTGRRAMEKTRPRKQQSLVDWARPRLKDKQKLELMMDPALEGQYSIEGTRRAALLAYHCLSNQAKARPSMGTVVKTLELILSKKEDIPIGPFVYVVPMGNNNNSEKQMNQNQKATVKEEDEEKKKARESKRHKKHREERQMLRVVVPRAVHSDTELYRSPKRLS